MDPKTKQEARVAIQALTHRANVAWAGIVAAICAGDTATAQAMRDEERECLNEAARIQAITNSLPE